ncbi:Fumarylacetoacetase [Burkholderiales bacterium]|nr:Fumarylacetoacetase [Burkholderiales bacterium]
MRNDTHDPGLQSWVSSANAAGCDFPIQNLPFGVFSPPAAADWRIGVAIGSAVLDLRAAVGRGVFSGLAWQALCEDSLNAYMALGPAQWSQVRAELSQGLRAGGAGQRHLEPCLMAQAAVRLRLPARIGDYSDFFTSIHHATRVGQLLRPESPLLPNYKWLPIAYHGRASSVVVSGTPVARPCGQIASRGATEPGFGPSQRLDYELELAAYVGPGNALGSAVPIAQAEQHVFGLCLLNDWSARDIQAWEYQPLGPFLAKSFATSVSPWIVSLEALEPYRCPWSRPTGDPRPLPYLDEPSLAERGAIDIRLGVWLHTRRLREEGRAAVLLSQSNYRDAYWCLAQMVAHQTVSGCNLCPGDLLATGTQSGPSREEGGCLLELTQGGKHPIVLPNGEERRFLEDGDQVTLGAWCEGPGAARIGFGSCVGSVLAARGP